MNIQTQKMLQGLENYPEFKDIVYCRGYLITTKQLSITEKYPFFNNWNETKLLTSTTTVYLYTHKKTSYYTYSVNNRIYFLVGHVYDPFDMLFDDQIILQNLATIAKHGDSAFWEKESDLTGIFCIGYIDADKITISTDAVGMQMVYYGEIENNIYISSHSQIIADLCSLTIDPFVLKLVSSKYYHYFGTWLPGDLAPYKELKRLQPNYYAQFDFGKSHIQLNRYFPLCKIYENEQEYNSTIKELGEIMSNNLILISRKWQDKRTAISVTGGRDSLTTLSCANGNYERFEYFSYISKSAEKVDAYAAKEICEHLGLNHSIYDISENYGEACKLDLLEAIINCNGGYTGKRNRNEIRKRLYFLEHNHFDIEVKSWLNEIGRGWYYNKYDKKSFPRRPSASYLRSMYKIILSPWLIHYTDKAFSDYLQKYYSDNVFDNLSWLELIYWEFTWAGNEGISLNAEHRLAYEITIPFNNRRYLAKMMTVPIQKRKTDCIPNDLIQLMNPKIAETEIKIKDADHTFSWTAKLRIYLEIMSRIRF